MELRLENTTTIKERVEEIVQFSRCLGSESKSPRR